MCVPCVVTCTLSSNFLAQLRNFLRNFCLSSTHRNFRKNFRESLADPNSPPLLSIVSVAMSHSSRRSSSSSTAHSTASGSTTAPCATYSTDASCRSQSIWRCVCFLRSGRRNGGRQVEPSSEYHVRGHAHTPACIALRERVVPVPRAACFVVVSGVDDPAALWQDEREACRRRRAAPVSSCRRRARMRHPRRAVGSSRPAHE